MRLVSTPSCVEVLGRPWHSAEVHTMMQAMPEHSSCRSSAHDVSTRCSPHCGPPTMGLVVATLAVARAVVPDS